MGVVCRVKRDSWQCGCYCLDYVGPGVSVVLLRGVMSACWVLVGTSGGGVSSCCIRKGCLVRNFSGYVHTGEVDCVLKVLSECM